MSRYRIMYEDSEGGHYRDVESNSLAHAVWELAKELCTGSLVDTMALPDKSNAYNVPVHVNLYPTITVEPD